VDDEQRMARRSEAITNRKRFLSGTRCDWSEELNVGVMEEDGYTIATCPGECS
jgi:hypothetical protein